MRLILASASPRRKELLEQIGVQFSVFTADIDETPRDQEQPRDYVCRMSLEKALRVDAQLHGKLSGGDVPLGEGDDVKHGEFSVLGADTIVLSPEDDLGCRRIMGKPENQAHAIEMMLSLSGRQHSVMTAVSMVCGNRCSTIVAEAKVTFAAMDTAMIRDYWLTGEPADKAGGYGIQGLGAVFVRELAGSYSAVVGLPLYETAQLLKEYGVPVWQVAKP
jgi:septum formation protein